MLVGGGSGVLLARDDATPLSGGRGGGSRYDADCAELYVDVRLMPGRAGGSGVDALLPPKRPDRMGIGGGSGDASSS